MKRVISSLLIATALVGSAIQPAAARDHRHHDNTGRIIAGGVAAGVVGGLIGGAIANGGGPRYVEEPRYVDGPRYVEPAPRCWYEDRDVRNRYDGGYHAETVRVCE
ncbi:MULTISPECIES: hypothetical protein [Rhizobium]|jgi:hypothetical protein|uniref:hypothetical protein n=1 Tax=Rhizobium TaxID=379 RepID=UPI00036C1D22|nr:MULTISPECIES: hypothetical protein [Rhizobium]QND18040.1 hypothetical protein HB775_30575 [Rhizobium leguminosarum bv. trifolii]MBA8833677.1 hypothetical protein [Rhizobium leguminosarum]MCJ9694726.1 hypothetical protein [Rhizobium sp. PRIMUS64]MDH6275389.1 hypothetical protein [Rhizobium leguminosarum]MVO93826.1 hypothetical protein [Rhizobium leguminosarum bv. phaseoli]